MFEAVTLTTQIALVLERPIDDVDRFFGDPFPVKAREHARRAAAIEAVAVVQNAEAHTAKVAGPRTSGQARFAR